MSEYDKELQTGTDEFEEATRPLRQKPADATRDEERERDEPKEDADTRPV